MVGIVIAAHGGFADGLKDAIRVITGQQSRLVTVSLRDGDNIEGLKDRILSSIKKVDDGNGCVIFTDLFGASPANAAAYLMDDKIIVISGANLPMILEILAVRNTLSVEEIAKIAVKAGRQSIKNLNDLLLEAIRKERAK